jgi:hypothetical protein
MRGLLIASFAAVSLVVSPVPAQVRAPVPSPLPDSIVPHPDWPKAAPGDVDTVDHVIGALYNVVSGPAGAPRNWNRFRSLFLPTGRLGVVRSATPSKDGKPGFAGDVVTLSPDTYVEHDTPYFVKNSFYERSVANRVETFGNLTSVWSTFESRHEMKDPKPFQRGINSVQLVKAQGRYWIANIVWEDEHDGLTLPQQYVK